MRSLRQECDTLLFQTRHCCDSAPISNKWSEYQTILVKNAHLSWCKNAPGLFPVVAACHQDNIKPPKE
jgi:hypothetical protein